MSPYYPEDLPAFYLLQIQILLGGGLSGYVKSKPLGNGQIISIDVAHETVVQRVRSNRWRFNFERARTGGQINFL